MCFFPGFSLVSVGVRLISSNKIVICQESIILGY